MYIFFKFQSPFPMCSFRFAYNKILFVEKSDSCTLSFASSFYCFHVKLLYALNGRGIPAVFFRSQQRHVSVKQYNLGASWRRACAPVALLPVCCCRRRGAYRRCPPAHSALLPAACLKHTTTLPLLSLEIILTFLLQTK